MDVTLLICSIVGGLAGIVALLTYRKDHVLKPKRQMQSLTIQFLANQTLAKQIRTDLVQYAEQNNARDLPFFQGVTFRSYISLLEKTLASDLSDETLKKVKEERLPDGLISSMSSSLDSQFANLSQVKNYLQLYFNSERN